MRLITRTGLAKGAAKKWKHSFHDQYGGHWLKPKYEETYDRLVALGDNPRPDDVERIIGGLSWMDLMCFTCDRDVEAVVVVMEDDGSGCEARVCLNCLRKLLGW